MAAVQIDTESEERISKTIKRNVGLFVAYRTLIRAQPIDEFAPKLEGGQVVIVVTPPGWRTQEYVRLLSDLRDTEELFQWAPRHADVLEITKRPIRRKAASGEIDVFDLSENSIVVTDDLKRVPTQVRFASDRILRLEKPLVADVHAARLAFQRPPISDELAVSLLDASHAYLLAGILRNQFDAAEVSRARVLQKVDEGGATLFDLPGYADAKAWARRVLPDIERWRTGALSWSEIGSAVILSGPPGTGKTLFAEAFSNAVGFHLVRTSVGSWQEAGPLDDTLRAMRESFSEAAASDGAVLFIDEIDSIGDRAQLKDERSAHYWRIVVNQFLALTSSVEDGVLLVGATNYPDAIDEAVIRSGRFEDRIELRLPTPQERADILAYHLRGVLSASDLLPLVADLDGQSAADIAKHARRAERRAREHARNVILDDVKAVLPPLAKLSAAGMFQIAVHESGHALVALLARFAVSGH